MCSCPTLVEVVSLFSYKIQNYSLEHQDAIVFEGSKGQGQDQPVQGEVPLVQLLVPKTLGLQCPAETSCLFAGEITAAFMPCPEYEAMSCPCHILPHPYDISAMFLSHPCHVPTMSLPQDDKPQKTSASFHCFDPCLHPKFSSFPTNGMTVAGISLLGFLKKKNLLFWAPC